MVQRTLYFRQLITESDKNSFIMHKTRLSAWIAGMFISLFSLNVHAQYTLTGTVTTSGSQAPVAGATVRFRGLERSATVSDAAGNFILAHIPAGNYVLQVTYLGYKPWQQELSVKGDVRSLRVSLENTGLFVKPVEIISTRAAGDAPFTETTLSGDAIRAHNLGRDLPYLLDQQPSVFLTSDAGTGIGYTNMWIRGSDITRINVTFNGIPVNDAESAGTFWVDIPDIASSTGSIQVQRGVGTSTNGAGAFGATVNLSTNEFHAEPYGEVSNSYGSFNTWKHEIKAGSGLLSGHFTIDARLSDITSDGYIDRATADLKSFYLSTAYFNKSSSLRFNVFSGKEKTYQAWDGVPEDSLKTHRTYNDLGYMGDGRYYDNQTDNYIQTYYQLFFNRQIGSRWSYSLAAFLTRGKGYYEEYKRDEPYAGYGLTPPVWNGDTLHTTDLVRDRWLDNYYYGTVFSLNHTGEKLNWHFGGGLSRYDGKHYGEVIWARYAIGKDYRYYYNTAGKNDFNLYWKGDRALTGKLQLFADVQYRHVGYRIRGFDHNPDITQDNGYDFLNPKAGLSFAVSRRDRLYASYALASKEPNRDDFEANLEETPRAEHLGDVEAGYDRRGSSYHLHGNVYYMHYHNQLVLTGRINDVGAYTRTNIPRSYRLGVELAGDIQFGRIWSAAANAAFSRNKIRDFTEYLDDDDNGGQKAVHHRQTDISFSPSVIAGASVTATPVDELSFTLTGKYVGRRYLDNSSNREGSLPAYLVNNLEARYSWHPGWIKAIDLHLAVINLGNIRYVTNGYTYRYLEDGRPVTENTFFPQAGFHLLGGIDLSF